MRNARYSTTRQKSCQACSAAKAKCDRKPAGCGRCGVRKLMCVYPRTGTLDQEEGVTPSVDLLDGSNKHSKQPPSIEAGAPPYRIDPAISASPTASRSTTSTYTPDIATDDLDFSDLHLICPIDASQISNRWLSPYVATSGQKPKSYPSNVTVFIRSVLSSYISKTASGRGYPPFVHSSQTTPKASKQPLSTCLTLVRTCEQPLTGSEGAIMEVLQTQMNNVFESHQTYDTVTMLAAFQAYVIYCMTLHFKFGQQSRVFLRQAMVHMQELASASSKHGLVCVAEVRKLRPIWEEWIVAESKRRTLFTMYMFDSLLTTEDGLPTFLGVELEGLFAPGRKALWGTQSRTEWERVYNDHLAQWTEGYLRIDELWPMPHDADGLSIERRHGRVQQWLEDVDEYGTMMYAVTSPTHGN